MKRLFSSSLIVSGILICFIPLIGTVFSSQKQDQLYQSYLGNQTIYDEIKDRGASEKYLSAIRDRGGASFEDDNLPDPGNGDSKPYSKNGIKPYPKPRVLGRIYISDIDVDLILVEGAGSKELKWGAGHISGTSLPGEDGNCAIAAHRNYTFGSYFSRLDELSTGSSVVVDFLGDTYNYIVIDKETVLPEDNTVLLPPDQGEILTLITCAPKGGNSHRLILRCAPVAVPVLPEDLLGASQ